MTEPPRIEVRRGSERFVTDAEGRRTRHSFSFGAHYDPDDVGFGLLICHNDDLVRPGHGYPDHPHRDLEIVTWVLEGALHHQDSTGHGGVITPGLVQRLSAGSGVVHAEVNDAADPVRFLQMWVRPDESGLDPGYEQRGVEEDLGRGGWVTLASGMGSLVDAAAVRLNSTRAALHAVRLRPGESVHLPEARWLHLFVARGGVEVERLGDLDTGDAARLSRSGGQRVSGSSPTGAEVLLWEMHSRPR